MDANHFKQQIGRLVETFGANHYKPERVNLIWREVKDAPDAWLTRVVDELIGSSRYAPLLTEFREHLSRLRESESQRKKVVSLDDFRLNKPRCTQCWDCGVFLCRKGDLPGVWAFRCHCSAGHNDPRKMIPQYKRDHRDEGYSFFERRPHGGGT